jgi:hypothetical protein
LKERLVRDLLIDERVETLVAILVLASDSKKKKEDSSQSILIASGTLQITTAKI